MAYTPQNFVSQVGPAIPAAWLNQVDMISSMFQPITTPLALPTSTAMSNGPPILMGAQFGTQGAPTTNLQPMLSFEKHVSGATNTYEGGAAWFTTFVEGGTSFSQALVGCTQINNGTGISAVAIHGYGLINPTAPGGQSVWSGWFTSHDLNPAMVNQCVAAEFDIVLGASRVHRTGNFVGGVDAAGIIINNQSDEVGNFNGTAGLLITGEGNAGGLGFVSKWYTGILMQSNGIVPGDANEMIQLNGGIGVSTNAYCGLRTTQTSFFTHVLDLSGWVTGNVSATAVFVHPIFQSDVTTLGVGCFSSCSTQAAAFTIGNLRCFEAGAGTIGAGSAVTNQVGFYADSSLGGLGTNNYGFYSILASGAGNWNFYAPGTAPNFMAGALGINGASPPAQKTGFGTPTGTGVIANFPGATATLAQATQAIAELIADLKAFGLYGA